MLDKFSWLFHLWVRHVEDAYLAETDDVSLNSVKNGIDDDDCQGWTANRYSAR